MSGFAVSLFFLLLMVGGGSAYAQNSPAADRAALVTADAARISSYAQMMIAHG